MRDEHKRTGALPSVAVVIPCYNSEKHIARAIQSALNQDCPNLKIVVVDDGSVDQSLNIVRSFNNRIRWDSVPHGGACAARNWGMRLARSDVTFFLDSDDYYRGSILADLSSALWDEDLDVAVGTYMSARGDEPPQLVQRFAAGAKNTELLAGWVRNRPVQTGALAWRTSFLNRIGGWNNRVRGGQDIELMVRALILGAKARSFDFGSVVYVNHPDARRISRSLGPETVMNKVAFVQALGKLTSSRSKQREVGVLAYNFAREAFRNDFLKEGQIALETSRSLGFRGHTGTFRHMAFSLLMGLRTKERLAVKWLQIVNEATRTDLHLRP